MQMFRKQEPPLKAPLYHIEKSTYNIVNVVAEELKPILICVTSHLVKLVNSTSCSISETSRREETMAGLIASGIIKWTTNKLSSLVSAPIGSSSSDEQQSSALRDVQMLQRTMARVQRTLSATDEDNVRDESERLRLRELQQFAYDAQDAIDEYKFELLRRMMDDPNNHGNTRGSRKRKRKGDKKVLAVYSS